MELSGPERYFIRFTPKEITHVASDKGIAQFSPPVTQSGSKIYVVHEDQTAIYVGKTTTSITARLSRGSKQDPRKNHGYSGHKWRRCLCQASIDIWLFQFDDKSTAKRDLETIEAEVVFLLRQQGQWPKFQTEIHFHQSDRIHRELAEQIVSHYRSASCPTA